jgi:hypothetical protein
MRTGRAVNPRRKPEGSSAPATRLDYTGCNHSISPMARYSPPKDVPALAREDLRKLWVEYPCPTVRRLVLEIKRLRNRTADAYGYTQLLLGRENWQTVDRARK